MKQNTTYKTLIAAAALSLGLASTALAQDANVAVPNPADEAPVGGLLGSRYTQVEYNYIDLDGFGPSHADGFGVTLNQPLRPNVDVFASYDWAEAEFAGNKFRVQDAEVGATIYSGLEWGKPFATAAVGWQWQKAGVFKDDSFAFKVGVGSEFQVAPAIVVTPFVNFVRATGFNANEFELGAKATYRINGDWSVTARAQYEAVEHSDNSAEYSLGVNYHF
jgi:hypothetical protein